MFTKIIQVILTNLLVTTATAEPLTLLEQFDKVGLVTARTTHPSIPIREFFNLVKNDYDTFSQQTGFESFGASKYPFVSCNVTRCTSTWTLWSQKIPTKQTEAQLVTFLEERNHIIESLASNSKGTYSSILVTAESGENRQASCHPKSSTSQKVSSWVNAMEDLQGLITKFRHSKEAAHHWLSKNYDCNGKPQKIKVALKIDSTSYCTRFDFSCEIATGILVETIEL